MLLRSNTDIYPTVGERTYLTIQETNKVAYMGEIRAEKRSVKMVYFGICTTSTPVAGSVTGTLVSWCYPTPPAV
jgi:hypothetical protein